MSIAVCSDAKSWIKESIPSLLLEWLSARHAVDAGPIYDQQWLDLEWNDLAEVWRHKLSVVTSDLVGRFVRVYPDSASRKRDQAGLATYYPIRCPADSRLDANQSIVEQLYLLRVGDNEHYPAYFMINGSEFVLTIRKPDSTCH